MSTPAVPREFRRPAPADWVLVVLLSGLSGVLALYGVFFLPLYVGSFPLPAVVVAIAAALVVLPRATYRLAARMSAAVAPVIVWFIVSIWLYLTPNTLFQSVPLAWRGWQFPFLVGVGALAAATSIGLLWGDQLRAGSGAGATRETGRG